MGKKAMNPRFVMKKDWPFSDEVRNRKIKIEKGVPIPPRSNGGRESKYPLSEMKKGDSFLITCDSSETSKTSRRLNSAVGNYQKSHGEEFQFKIRTVPEEGGVRIWRTK